MPDRLTSDEVMTALVSEGWVIVDNIGNYWNAKHPAKSSLASWEMTLSFPFFVSYGVPHFQGQLPATLSDLWALLRCLGAPVPEDEPTSETQTVDGSWLKGEPLRSVERGLSQEGTVDRGSFTPVADDVVLPRTEGKRPPERRKEDRPELIPCKLCGWVPDTKVGHEEQCVARGIVLYSDWRILNGRRVTDWRKG